MKKKLFICGIDGYIGWAFANWMNSKFSNPDWEVSGLDFGLRRRLVQKAKSVSAIPIAGYQERMKYLGGDKFFHCELGMNDYYDLKAILESIKPDVILHLGEMPAAPYSMLGGIEAMNTVHWNVEGTMALLWAMKDCNLSSHIIKLGTMGIHGTPKITIPEGYEIRHDSGEPTKHLFYKKPGSYYHSTKVADTYNIEMACRLWGFRCTDIQQGVVYGHIPVANKFEETRFDFDSQFGTAVNRFVMQAVAGVPITPYGKGNQKRGFLPLEDVMQCLNVVMEHTPEEGEYRSINQFDRVYSINELAETVKTVWNSRRGNWAPAVIKNCENPRIEEEDHKYPVVSEWLRNHGYKPKEDMEGTLAHLMDKLVDNKPTWEKYTKALDPDHKWNGGKI